MDFNTMVAYSLLGRASLNSITVLGSQFLQGGQRSQQIADHTTCDRADAAVIGQGSTDAFEGSCMAQSICSAAGELAKDLDSMKKLVDALLARSPVSITVEDQARFNDLARDVSSIVVGAKYNDISLMDSPSWASDQRLTVSGSGTDVMASLSLQLGYRVRRFFLQDMSRLKDLVDTDLTSFDTDTAKELTSLSNRLGDHLSDVAAMADRYKNVGESYERESQFILARAERCDDVTDNAFSDSFDPLLGNKRRVLSSSA